MTNTNDRVIFTYVIIVTSVHREYFDNVIVHVHFAFICGDGRAYNYTAEQKFCPNFLYS